MSSHQAWRHGTGTPTHPTRAHSSGMVHASDALSSAPTPRPDTYLTCCTLTSASSSFARPLLGCPLSILATRRPTICPTVLISPRNPRRRRKLSVFSRDHDRNLQPLSGKQKLCWIPYIWRKGWHQRRILYKTNLGGLHSQTVRSAVCRFSPVPLPNAPSRPIGKVWTRKV